MMDKDESHHAKRSISAADLEQISRSDLKRAKKILANRKSAEKSKERKRRYTDELEKKVKTLEAEVLLQRDTNALASQNSELKQRLPTMEEHIQLQDALNNSLKEEIQRLKVVTGQTTSQLTLLQRDMNGLTSDNRELKQRLQTMEEHIQLQDALTVPKVIQHQTTGNSDPASYGSNQQQYYGYNQTIQDPLTNQPLQIHSHQLQQQEQRQFVQHQLHQIQQQFQQHQPHRLQQQSNASSNDN